MTSVAIIPARAGSKRIPNKNIRPFMGKPIIAYSIEAALETKLFKRIIVSTDSEEISRISRKYGAETPFVRPAELSDDFTGTDAVVLHALDWLMDQGDTIDYVCCIYATAPFIRPQDIIRGNDLIRQHGAESAVSVASFPFPIFRGIKINAGGRLEMFWPEHFTSRSQDLPKGYHDAGQFYWAEAKRYRQNKRFFSNDALPVILPRYLVQDIDTPEDWSAAEILYRFLKEGKHSGGAE